MRKELIWSLPGLYREDMEVYGYHFGRGDKAACVVGALRGNEVQQMYVWLPAGEGPDRAGSQGGHCEQQ